MAKKKKKDAAAWMYDVIERPVVTEKSTLGSEHGQVTFQVALDSTKPQIKQAVETLFGVKVRKVNTLITKGKIKSFRGSTGRRSDMKKAMVTLEDGQAIDIATGI